MKIRSTYIIVGGWSPYLLNSTDIQHPGTKDVDILFERGYEKKHLKEIIEILIKSGFLLSAKHDFQLFKKIRVKDYEFIYNIDLLHPFETAWESDIFVDHLELDVPADKYKSRNFKMKSIALPDSNVLFDNYFTEFEIDFPLSNGEQLTQKVRLMNELGCLITKSKSVKIKKRFRDSLDIYLAIKQSRNYEELVAQTLELKKKNRSAFNSLYGIREAFEDNILYLNILRYVKPDRSEFSQVFQDYFERTGINKSAQNI